MIIQLGVSHQKDATTIVAIVPGPDETRTVVYTGTHLEGDSVGTIYANANSFADKMTTDEKVNTVLTFAQEWAKRREELNTKVLFSRTSLERILMLENERNAYQRLEHLLREFIRD
jgi:hypothetical protein